MTAGSMYAQANRPDAQGTLDRGILMYEDRNFEGCLDQLTRLSTLNPTASQEEKALYYRGLAAQGLGDDEALGLFRKFLETYPVSPLRADVMMSVGDYYFNRGNYPKALEEYARVNPLALTDDRTDDMTYRIAYSYMQLGELSTAAGMFRGLQGKPRYANAARFYLGYIAYTGQDYPLALQYFRSVDTSREPGKAAPYYEAQINFAQGDYKRTLELSRSLIASGSVPQFTAECNRLAGESLYNLGQEEDALPYLWKYCAEAANPQPSAFYILGVSEYRKGNYDEAVKLLQQAISDNSAMGQSAYLFLGQAYLKRGDNNSALMAFENAYRRDFDREVRETAFYNYAVARMDGGRVPFGNSVALLESFLKEYPDSRYSADVQRYIVNGYMTDNDYESALAALDRIARPSAELVKAKQRVLLVLGSREYSSGKISQAITHLTQAKRIASADPSIARRATSGSATATSPAATTTRPRRPIATSSPPSPNRIQATAPSHIMTSATPASTRSATPTPSPTSATPSRCSTPATPASPRHSLPTATIEWPTATTTHRTSPPQPRTTTRPTPSTPLPGTTPSSSSLS